MVKTAITRVKARQILDSRGEPTLEADVYLADGSFGRSSVPAGASKGKYEAVEKRDEKDDYHGKGVISAISGVNYLGSKFIGLDAAEQEKIDNLMIALDGTDNKKNIGANAILAVSLAVAKAYASSEKMPLYRYFGSLIGNSEYRLPVPFVNIWNGGAHAGWATDLQEYMIVPFAASSFSESLRWCSEIFHTLKELLEKSGYATTVGDEGGFAPLNVKSNEEPLEWILKAIEKSGYWPEDEVAIALDAASSAFYRNGKYILNFKERENGRGIMRSTDEMIDFYKELKRRFPIVSIEDGLNEEDWNGWVELTKTLGSNTEIVGDDLYATNKGRLERGIELRASNAILIKPNQIGTLTETLDVIRTAMKNGYAAIISHRSGETEDTTISHLAVGTATGQIKAGSVCRGERICKYNELLRIEEELGKSG
ncbi:MAG: phosphopyruvate hydratase [Candidatus Aenigmarchaeota archaeon]|nr:phosphopyruvate hydratase [Candidatus Aenigmarchaeota archaeon]